MNTSATTLLVGLTLGASSCLPNRQPGPTLRQLYGLHRPAQLQASHTALLLIDFQQEFFSGRLPVEGGEEAVQHALALRAWAHREGVRVVLVRNEVPRVDSPVFAIGSAGTRQVSPLEPLPDELVVTKRQAGAFSGTALAAELRTAGIDTLILGGIMTHLAVDTSARDAAVAGFAVIVASDACATRALPGPEGGPAIDAATVHRVALAALADRFADVLTAEAVQQIPVTR
jgi:nicotinamidase-related amidase